MSHFSTLRTKITDAEILKVSLRDLGLQQKQKPMSGATTVSVFGLTWFAVLEGEYDLGWSQQRWFFDLIADLWGVASITRPS